MRPHELWRDFAPRIGDDVMFSGPQANGAPPASGITRGRVRDVDEAICVIATPAGDLVRFVWVDRTGLNQFHSWPGKAGRRVA